MLPNPSYAPDAQLRSMAQGGLPSAVNEEIQRLALRRGARAVPQPPIPQSPPQGKMSAEDMIKDFVDRVRKQNEQASQSLVPIGTPQPQPQQQPQQPPQGGPPPRPQGAAPKPKGFQYGGVNLPTLQNSKIGIAVAKPEDDPNFSGRGQDGYYSPPVRRAPPPEKSWGDMMDEKLGFLKKGGPILAVPGTEQFYAGGPGGGKADSGPAPSSLDGMFWQGDPNNNTGPFQNPSAGIAAAAGASSGSASGLGIEMPGRTKMGKLPDRVQFNAPDGPGEYISPERVDPLAERDKMIKDNKGKIRDARKPYDDAAAETSADLEENKRKSFFRAIIEAGVTAMQAGGPSTDPASGDFMSIAGASLGQYVESLDRDKAYQERLKDKITNYKIGAGEAQTRAEDRFGNLGMAAAESKNAFSVADAAGKNNYHMGIAGLDMQAATTGYQGEVSQRASEIGAMVAQYQTDASFDLAAFKATLDLKVAEMANQGGIDPKLMQQIGAKAEDIGMEAYKSYLSNSGFSEVTDPAQRESMLQAAQAQYVGAKVSALTDQLRNMGIKVSDGDLLAGSIQSATGMASVTGVDAKADGSKPSMTSTYPAAPSWGNNAQTSGKVYDGAALFGQKR